MRDWPARRPALHLLLVVGKDTLGLVLLLAGLAMLVLPGQGLLTIFVPIMLLDFPRQHDLEQWLIRRRPLFRAGQLDRDKRMNHHHETDARLLRHAGKQLLERPQAPGRSSDAHHPHRQRRRAGYDGLPPSVAKGLASVRRRRLRIRDDSRCQNHRMRLASLNHIHERGRLPRLRRTLGSWKPSWSKRSNACRR